MTNHTWFEATGAGLLLGGFIPLIWLWRSWRYARASQMWPYATGRILRSYVAETVSTDRDGLQSTAYHAKVDYEYIVESQTLKGNRIRFGGNWGGGQKGASALVAQYPEGALVDVYYDPALPTRCTLDRTTSKASLFAIFGIALLLFTLGIAFLLASTRATR